jgi:hypothetical protein
MTPRIAEEAMFIVFELRSGSCVVQFLSSNLSNSGINDYTRRKVIG